MLPTVAPTLVKYYTDIVCSTTQIFSPTVTIEAVQRLSENNGFCSAGMAVSDIVAIFTIKRAYNSMHSALLAGKKFTKESYRFYRSLFPYEMRPPENLTQGEESFGAFKEIAPYNMALALITLNHQFLSESIGFVMPSRQTLPDFVHALYNDEEKFFYTHVHQLVTGLTMEHLDGLTTTHPER